MRTHTISEFLAERQPASRAYLQRIPFLGDSAILAPSRTSFVTWSRPSVSSTPDRAIYRSTQHGNGTHSRRYIIDFARTISRSNIPSLSVTDVPCSSHSTRTNLVRLRPYGGEIRFPDHFQLPMTKIAQSRRQCQRHQPKARRQHSVKVLGPATPLDWTKPSTPTWNGISSPSKPCRYSKPYPV